MNSQEEHLWLPWWPLTRVSQVPTLTLAWPFTTSLILFVSISLSTRQENLTHVVIILKNTNSAWKNLNISEA